MNTKTMKMTTIALGFGVALFSGATIAWTSTFGPDANPGGDQKAYLLAAEQGAPRHYLYIDLQSGEAMRWKCENANGKRVKKYVELPTGKILHLNCGK